MKYVIIKDHLDQYKEGETVDLSTDDGNYLVAMGVARGGKGETDSPSLKQKEELQAKAAKESAKETKPATTKVSEAPKKSLDITTGNKTAAPKKGKK